MDRFPVFQWGATLVVVLAMLLVMMLMAVSMMNTAILQEQMAGNNRQKTASRYTAESALNKAETVISAKNFGNRANMRPLFDSAVKGYYSAVNLFVAPGISRTAVPVDFDITDVSAWDDNANSVAVTDLIDTTVTAKAPRYIIEYIGQQQPDVAPVQSPDSGDPTQSGLPYFFRVAAIGWGKDPEIYTILQSIYRLKPAAVGNTPDTAIDDFYGDSDRSMQPGTKTRTEKGTDTSIATPDNGRISWSIIH